MSTTLTLNQSENLFLTRHRPFIILHIVNTEPVNEGPYIRSLYKYTHTPTSDVVVNITTFYFCWIKRKLATVSAFDLLLLLVFTRCTLIEILFILFSGSIPCYPWINIYISNFTSVCLSLLFYTHIYIKRSDTPTHTYTCTRTHSHMHPYPFYRTINGQFN